MSKKSFSSLYQTRIKFFGSFSTKQSASLETKEFSLVLHLNNLFKSIQLVKAVKFMYCHLGLWLKELVNSTDLLFIVA